MNARRTVPTLVAVLALGLGLSACGSDDDADAAPAAATSPSASPDASAAPSTGDDTDADDRAVDAATRDRLEQVALDEVGEDRVEDVERSDDADHAYEVDVDLAGSGDDDVTVEVAEDFSVVRVDR